MRITSLLTTAVIAMILTGCSTLPIEGKLPDNLTAQKLTTVADSSAFAISPDGSVAALYNSGFKLFHIPSKDSHPLGERKPAALAWSPLGYSLAALYNSAGKSSIAIYDQFGLPMVEQPLDDYITGICWLSEQELVAGGLRVKSYKFGTNYKSIFYRWKPGRGQPALTELRDSTLQPVTFSRWQALLERGPMITANGTSGQIAYLQPADPPVFTPYYKVIIRDLATGRELETATAGFTTGGPRFSLDGENLLYGDGSGNLILLNPWSEEKLKSIATPGTALVFSPDSSSWFADGALFSGAAPTVTLAPGGEAAFSGDGSRLFIRSGSNLYQLSGIKVARGSQFTPEVAEKVAKLRAMRMQGLITAAEYRNSIERILKP